VPTLLYRAQNYRDVPGESPFPEVAFLGRSNVGKSSLFNTLLCTSPTAAHRAQHAKVSKKAGKTKMLIGYGIGGQGQVGADPSARPESGTQRNERAWTRMGRGGLVMVDMPGYGMASRAEWGRTAMEFLRGRKQLRRIFVLVDCSHRIKQKDVAILRLLTEENLPVTLVLSKVDKILSPGKKAVGEESVGRRLQKLQEVKGLMVQMLADEGIVKRAGKKGDMFSLDLLCVSAEKNLNGRAIGIDELRWSIMGACGIEVDG
jgi:GTP-binding protein